MENISTSMCDSAWFWIDEFDKADSEGTSVITP